MVELDLFVMTKSEEVEVELEKRRECFVMERLVITDRGAIVDEVEVVVMLDH